MDNDQDQDVGGEDSPDADLRRLEERLGARRIRRKPPGQVHILIEPGETRGQIVLNRMNKIFQATDVDWNVFVVHEPEEALRLAQQAAVDSVDVLAVYGGDRLIAQAAAGLVDTSIPLALLPGGRGNTLALELGLPHDLSAACALAMDPTANVKRIDLAQIEGGPYFLLRASLGFEAVMAQGIDPQAEARLGLLAYLFSALDALANPPYSGYRLVLDGRELETEGVACLVANAGTMGVPGAGVRLIPEIDPADGLLDVVVIRKADLASLVSLAAQVVSGGVQDRRELLHWQAAEVTVTSEPSQSVQIDGQMLSMNALTTRVIPQSVQVVIPAGPKSGQTD